MNAIEEYNYVMEKDLESKERFYRFAEVLGVANKERPETWEALKKYKRYIKPDSHVAEIGAGHGLLGTWLAWLGISYVTLYDSRYAQKPPIAYKLAIKFKPYLANVISYSGEVLNSESIIKADAIIGIHCCGDLSDFVLRCAVKNNASVAVMTCCHGKTITKTKRCEANINLRGLDIKGRTEIDINRAVWLSSKNYTVKIKRIPKHITGEPRMILGRPNKHNNENLSYI